MPNELDILQDVTKRLDCADIAYMLTGSIALNFYAQPRMTRDIDIVFSLPPNAQDSIRALFEPEYYVPHNLANSISKIGMFNLLHHASVIKVDMIVRKDDLYRQTEFARRVKFKLAANDIWIVSREDLILSKLVWAQESHSELQIRDVRNLLQAEVDSAYLDLWSRYLSIEHLLNKCRHG